MEKFQILEQTWITDFSANPATPPRAAPQAFRKSNSREPPCSSGGQGCGCFLVDGLDMHSLLPSPRRTHCYSLLAV